MTIVINEVPNIDDFPQLEGDELFEENTEETVENTEEEFTEKEKEKEPKVEEDSLGKPSVFSHVAKAWHNKGLLGDIDEKELEVKDEESFLNLLDKQAEARAKQILIDKYGEEDASYMEQAADIEADPEVLKNFDEYIKGINQNLRNIGSDELADYRKSVITAYYINKGFDAAKADKQAQRSIDLGTDVEDATEMARELINMATEGKNKYIENATNAKKAEEDKKVKYVNDINETLKKTKELIPGVPLTAKDKENIKDSIFKPSGSYQGKAVNAVDKYMLENPVEARVILGYLLSVTKNFKDWSVLAKPVKKTVTKGLESILSESELFTGGSGNNNFGDILEMTEDDLARL